MKRKCLVVPHLAIVRLEDYRQCRGVTSGIRADSGGVKAKEIDLTNRWNQQLVWFCQEPSEW